ncbi:MAG: hypothetical protein Q8Q96_01345 [bacterium]|nr:hypothetical protein [bacterium]
MFTGIERLILAGVVAGGAGIVIAREALNPHDSYGFSGFPQEGGKIVGARLTPVLSNYSGKLEGPAVRKKPQIDGELLNESDLLKKGVNAHEALRGFKIWGGTYPSLDRRGSSFKQGERFYGSWLAIVNGEKEVAGYVAENFVTYLP